jgi:hypothetical protein
MILWKRAIALLAPILLAARAFAYDYDILVYGSTPAGIQAAVAAAGEGRTALIVSPTARIGGMMTGGLGASDIGNASAIGGASLRFFLEVCKHYSKPNATEGCWHFEPHVALKLFDELLAAHPSVRVLTNATLVSVARAGATIVSVTTAETALVETADTLPSGAATTVITAAIFVDATYEGDLLAAAQIPTVIGRESAEVYNESHAGVLTEPSPFGKHQFDGSLDPIDAATGDPLPQIMRGPPGAVGSGDRRVQAYNYRLCMTANKSNARPFPKPHLYDPHDWELLRRFLNASKPKSIASIMNLVSVPGGKTDTNNNGPVSTDFIGGSWAWPTATPAARREIWAAHYAYTTGFLFTLQHDTGVDAALRAEALQWGLAADEFVETNGWPAQLYVREGRRLLGEYVFTQQDRQFDLRKSDSVGLFSYNIDSHHVQRYIDPTTRRVLNEGDFEQYGGPLGQIPLRSLLPKRADATNLFAPVPLSASHMGYGCLRVEPQLMIIGEAVGVAAALAVSTGVAVQDIHVPTLQARLRALGAKIDL